MGRWLSAVSSKWLGATLAVAVSLQAATVVPADAAQITPANSNGSYLFTPCLQTASAEPSSVRPLARRVTLASPVPHRPVRHRTVRRRTAVHHKPRPVVRKRPVVAKPRPVVQHRPVVRHRTVAHRPPVAHRRPLLRKVTYASPICADRAPLINALLGDITTPLFQPIAAPVGLPVGGAPIELAQGPIPPTPITNPIVPELLPPTVPLAPGGSPPGGGGGPPVVPVPEPASWLMMVLGFGMAGSMLRRSRRGRPRQAA